jgi:O-antigen/teichoic acid export membrane protein
MTAAQPSAGLPVDVPVDPSAGPAAPSVAPPVDPAAARARLARAVTDARLADGNRSLDGRAAPRVTTVLPPGLPGSGASGAGGGPLALPSAQQPALPSAQASAQPSALPSVQQPGLPSSPSSGPLSGLSFTQPSVLPAVGGTAAIEGVALEGTTLEGSTVEGAAIEAAAVQGAAIEGAAAHGAAPAVLELPAPAPPATGKPEETAAPPPADRGGVDRTVRGGWFGFVGSGVNAVFGFALVAIVTHAVGARGAGAVFTGVAVFTILSNAFKLGADTGLVRFVSRDLETAGGSGVRALLRTAVVPALVASTAGAALLLLSPALATHLLPDLGRDEAIEVMRLFAVFLPVTTVSLVLLGATRGYGTVLPFVGVEQIGKPVLRVLLALPLAVLAPGIVALSAAWLLPSLAGALVAWWALRRARRAHPPRTSAPPGTGEPPGTRRRSHRRGGERPRAAREFWAFSGPRAISSVFDITAVWVGVILLSLLGTTQDAGIYTAITRVVTAGTLLQLAIRLAVAPQISRLLAGGNDAQAHHLHRLSTRWIVLFSWPLFVLLGLFPATSLVVFGGGFTHGAAALAVLCVACAVNVGVGNAQTVILMAGRSSWNLGVAAAAFVVQVVSGVALVPRYGVLGASVSWGLAIVVDNVASALLVRYRLGFTTVDRGYLAAAALGLGSVAAVAAPVRLVVGDTLTGTLLGIGLGVSVFLLGLWRYRVALGVSEFFGALRNRSAGNRGVGSNRTAGNSL